MASTAMMQRSPAAPSAGLSPLCPAARGACCCTPRRRPAARGRLQVVAVGWDPEGILAAPKGGHIQRRSLAKQIAQDKELAEKVEQVKQQARQELLAAREARKPPSTHAELVEYFLDTEGEEMDFEVARCRPMITEDFMTFLASSIGQERFAAKPNEDRVGELEALQQFLQQAAAAFDAKQQTVLEPVDRLKQLLAAKDKRATLLEMAGDNQIDQPLLDLLQQNIAAAKAGGQSDAATFMERVHDAARKFLISR